MKFGLPQVYAASTLGWSYYEFKDTFVAKGQDKYMLNVLKHFTDYFLKCYIDYNAGFVGALAGLTNYYGKDQLPEGIPGIEPKTPEYFVEAKVMEETNQFVTIDAFLHNDSLLPPHYENQLTFRYFFDLSEYYKNGLTVNDVSPRLNYGADGGIVSKIMPWDEANHIYYIEASWPNTELYGKAEFQFALTAYNSKLWDSTNDYSRKELTDALTSSEFIPVYRNGVVIVVKRDHL